MLRKYTFIGLIFFSLSWSCQSKKADDATFVKPNILWITCEDITPMLGCYDDPVAKTPNLDNLARQGVRYTNAYATAAVCSPARSCLVTGVYATSLGTQNLRSEFKIPSELRTLPHIMRQNGYYCTNNEKEDYNFTDTTIWDESSVVAHWRNRPPGTPFYSVFNIETTHQSKIFGSDAEFEARYGESLAMIQRQKANEVPLASYFFDTPEVRKLWARYYDLVAIMDGQVGEILGQLEEDGLAENTIVFFFSDHGTGMPRSKRALYNSGVQVPFILHVPEAFAYLSPHEIGTTSDRIVSFVDFAPTVLSLAGIQAPPYMQGRAFLGKHIQEPAEYAFATSDRVDEAFEISRTVKGRRFAYIRNFLPHLPLIQPNFYSDKSEIMKELYRVKSSIGYENLTLAQQSIWLPRRPAEELYDLENDPEEVHNLTSNPDYQDVLVAMRRALKDWMISTHDTGLMPEAYMLQKTDLKTAYEIAQDTIIFPIRDILYVNDYLITGSTDELELIRTLNHTHELVRYWTLIALQNMHHHSPNLIQNIIQRLSDSSMLVKLAAVECLCSIDFCDAKPREIILEGMKSFNKAEALYAARIFELNFDKNIHIHPQVNDIRSQLISSTTGNWKGYDLYALWALESAFQSSK